MPKLLSSFFFFNEMSQANVHETVVMISEDPTSPVTNCSLLGNSALLGFTFP